MSKSLLVVKNLQVAVDGKVVISGLDLAVSRGQVQVIMGNNGSGKSTLAMTLMGDARYQTSDSSEVRFGGVDLLSMTPDERARAGLYVAWQSPLVIPGVSVFSLCKASYEAWGNKIDKLTEFKQKLENLAEEVGLTREHIGRSVNEGFSGGERKRLELLQLLLLSPKLAILDEIDSGIDSQGVKMLTGIVEQMKGEGTSFILITHNQNVWKNITVDRTWEMKNGQLQPRI